MSAGSHQPWQPPEGFVNPVPPDAHDPPPVRPAQPPPEHLSWPAPPPLPPQQQPESFGLWPVPWQQQPVPGQPPQQLPPQPWPPQPLPPQQMPIPPGYWQPQPVPWQPPLEAVAPTPPPESSRLRLVTLLLVAGVLGLIGASALLDRSSSDSGGRVFDFSEEQAAEEGYFTEIAVDGRSSLPGDHVAVRYTPTTGDSEWTHSESIDAPDDGSSWWLSSSRGGHDDGIELAYYVYRPPFDNAQRRTEFERWMYSENSTRAKGRINFSRVQIAGREALKYEFGALTGKRILQVWMVGPVHSYRYECRIMPDNAAMWSRCNSMLQTLKIND